MMSGSQIPEPPTWDSGAVMEFSKKSPYKDLIDRKKKIPPPKPQIKETGSHYLKWSVDRKCPDKVVNWYLNQMLGDFKNNPCSGTSDEVLRRIICRDLEGMRECHASDGFLSRIVSPDSKVECRKTSHETSEGEGPFDDKIFLISGESNMMMCIYLWRADMIHCLTFMMIWDSLEVLLPPAGKGGLTIGGLGVPLSERELPDSLFYVTSSQKVLFEQEQLYGFLTGKETFMMEADPLLNLFSEKIGLIRTLPEKADCRVEVGEKSTLSDTFLRWMEDLDVTSEDRFTLIHDYHPLSRGLLTPETAFRMLNLILDEKTAGDEADITFVVYFTECMASLKQLKDTGRIKSMEEWCFYPGVFGHYGDDQDEGEGLSKFVHHTSWKKNLLHFFPSWMSGRMCPQVAWLHKCGANPWIDSEVSEEQVQGATVSQAQVIEEKYFLEKLFSSEVAQ